MAGQPGHEWQAQMELKGVPPIRRRNKPASPHPHDLRRHLSLIVQIADMLDNRIAVDQVKVLIGPGQTASISRSSVNLREPLPNRTGVLFQAFQG